MRIDITLNTQQHIKSCGISSEAQINHRENMAKTTVLYISP